MENIHCWRCEALQNQQEYTHEEKQDLYEMTQRSIKEGSRKHGLNFVNAQMQAMMVLKDHPNSPITQEDLADNPILRAVIPNIIVTVMDFMEGKSQNKT